MGKRRGMRRKVIHKVTVQDLIKSRFSCIREGYALAYRETFDKDIRFLFVRDGELVLALRHCSPHSVNIDSSVFALKSRPKSITPLGLFKIDE